jgi:dolichol-phosphate mannosyltransferase
MYYTSMSQHHAENNSTPEFGTAMGKKSSISVIFWTVLGITTLMRLTYALKLPLTGDEAYFWEWGRHPALGYYDHPPVAGWILWFTRQIFGDTVGAVRIPAVLAGTMVVTVIHRFTLDITGSRKWAALTGLLAIGIPVLSAFGVIYSTDTPVLAAGTLGGYFFHRAVNRGNDRAWIWTGICFAIVLGSKFLGVPLLGAAALYLLLNPGARGHLKTPGPYAAAALSLLGFIPVIIWNASNEWATFAFNFTTRHSSSSFSLKSVLDYLAGQALGLSPMVFLLAIPILAASIPVWREGGEKGRRLAAFFALAPLGGFLLLSPVTKVGVHWPAVAVPFLAVALGAKLSAAPTSKKTYFATAATAWSITIVLFLIPLVPYLLPADWAYPLRPEKINTAQLRKIMGSPVESGKMVGAVLEEMEQEGELFAFTRSYALSSLMAFYTPAHPEVTVLGKGSVHGRNHLLWFNPTDHTGKNALFVSYKPVPSETDFLKQRFDSLTTVVDSGGPEGSLISVVKCYGYKGIR